MERELSYHVGMQKRLKALAATTLCWTKGQKPAKNWTEIIVKLMEHTYHTIYTRNDMGQKCEGNCGLWVLNEIHKKPYPESLKKIVGAVWELPAK